eukprot:CAMPEP_0183448808 /NCGR_PEP_ID=MMETSP0370-20130417/107612_1 /TAXON_ID=268820 /ORGANISM="Peridinium aciculiferum, Strain PAER-2" /LENGTH=89 /DNA_ID=CAMNT_0025639815 /DNA_START=138 /DNA_END=404 /DNA_ORIENTATION=-
MSPVRCRSRSNSPLNSSTRDRNFAVKSALVFDLSTASLFWHLLLGSASPRSSSLLLALPTWRSRACRANSSILLPRQTLSGVTATPRAA